MSFLHVDSRSYSYTRLLFWYDLCMRTLKITKANMALFLMVLGIAACTEKQVAAPPPADRTADTAQELSGSCGLPPLAVNVGVELDSGWGKNAPGAFPFTRGGAEPAPSNVDLTLRLNFKSSGGVLALSSVTGETPAGDKIFLPALVGRPVRYSAPQGGYTATPERYVATGCDSIWNSAPSESGGIATQNPDGSYKAQCASVAMDVIPVVFTHSGNEFSSDLANSDLSSFADAGNTGWIDSNTGRVMIGQKTYSHVTRGWELAARLEDAGVAKFSATQIPWANGVMGQVDANLVRQQSEKFGVTESHSGSDYTYRTDGYTHDGKWAFSHGHYSKGIPKSGPGRLSSGVAMFRIAGTISSDGKDVAVKNFSYSGPMLVCPTNGQECTASPGRSFTGLSCSFTF